METKDLIGISIFLIYAFCIVHVLVHGIKNRINGHTDYTNFLFTEEYKNRFKHDWNGKRLLIVTRLKTAALIAVFLALASTGVDNITILLISYSLILAILFGSIHSIIFKMSIFNLKLYTILILIALLLVGYISISEKDGHRAFTVLMLISGGFIIGFHYYGTFYQFIRNTDKVE